ncbi:MAG: hypothetical protein LQ338_001329 [Usnochroma carphineum]|nr:MAG: hypothetical protein LQ338_001329 [Usnochroma carphineum]
MSSILSYRVLLADSQPLPSGPLPNYGAIGQPVIRPNQQPLASTDTDDHATMAQWLDTSESRTPSLTRCSTRTTRASRPNSNGIDNGTPRTSQSPSPPRGQIAVSTAPSRLPLTSVASTAAFNAGPRSSTQAANNTTATTAPAPEIPAETSPEQESRAQQLRERQIARLAQMLQAEQEENQERQFREGWMGKPDWELKRAQAFWQDEARRAGEDEAGRQAALRLASMLQGYLEERLQLRREQQRMSQGMYVNRRRW